MPYGGIVYDQEAEEVLMCDLDSQKKEVPARVLIGKGRLSSFWLDLSVDGRHPAESVRPSRVSPLGEFSNPV
jgi:hypothetical protein